MAAAVKARIEGVGARKAYIEKASPWENGHVESFNGKLRDELLKAEVFNTLREAQVLIEDRRQHYNRVRPHSSLGYHPPAPETMPMARSQISSQIKSWATRRNFTYVPRADDHTTAMGLRPTP